MAIIGIIQEVMLILLPHVSRDLISPLVRSGSLSWVNRASQFTHITVTGIPSELEAKWFIDIHINILRVIYPDEIMKRCKCGWNEGLNTHVILWRSFKYSKTPLEDPKDLLNDIAG